MCLKSHHDAIDPRMKDVIAAEAEKQPCRKHFQARASISVGEIAEGLLRDNLTDEQVGGILGLNWLRVAREVWK